MSPELEDKKRELEANLLALRMEQQSLSEWMSTIDDEIRLKRKRLEQLNDGYHSAGLVKRAEYDLRDIQFPIWESDPRGFNRTRRIVGVDSKYVSLRHDQGNDLTRYRRTDGIRERCQDGPFADKIDIARALAIWTLHQESK